MAAAVSSPCLKACAPGPVRPPLIPGLGGVKHTSLGQWRPLEASRLLAVSSTQSRRTGDRHSLRVLSFARPCPSLPAADGHAGSPFTSRRSFRRTPPAPADSAGAPPHRAAPRGRSVAAAAAAGAASGAVPPAPKPPAAAPSRKLSDALWPGIGAFLAYCGLAAMDHFLLPKKLTMSLASYAAVCSLLFAMPQAPASQRRRVLVAHLVSALLGVAAMAALGPTWLARSVAVGLSISFMILADCMHPPAAGLPVIFIDGPKFHHLGWWYPLCPAFLGCLWLFLLQEVILFLKDKIQF